MAISHPTINRKSIFWWHWFWFFSFRSHRRCPGNDSAVGGNCERPDRCHYSRRRGCSHEHGNQY